MKLAEKESLDRSGPGCAREPGRDSYRSKAKERRRGGPVDTKSPEAVDTASTEVAGEAVGAGVLPCRGDHAGRLRAVSGRDLPAVPSIRAQGTAGRRVGPMGAAPPHGYPYSWNGLFPDSRFPGLRFRSGAGDHATPRGLSDASRAPAGNRPALRARGDRRPGSNPPRAEPGLSSSFCPIRLRMDDAGRAGPLRDGYRTNLGGHRIQPLVRAAGRRYRSLRKESLRG